MRADMPADRACNLNVGLSPKSVSLLSTQFFAFRPELLRCSTFRLRHGFRYHTSPACKNI